MVVLLPSVRSRCLPGGFIEFGEDFLTAGIREETGLVIEVTAILNVCSNFLAADLQTLVIVLRGTIVKGTPVPGDDLVDLDWVCPQGDLPPMAFDSDAHIVRRFGGVDATGIHADDRFRHRRP